MTDLVVFGEDWGRHPSSTQHLVRQLVHNRRALWVNSIGLRRPRLNVSDLNRIGSKLSAARNSSRPAREQSEVPHNLSVLRPIAIPWPGSRIAGLFNRKALSSQIRAALGQRKIEKPILWTSLPTAVVVAGSLNESAIVYYCGDDFGALPGVDHAPVMAMERELAHRADLIVAASEVLASRFPPGKTLLVPHGVDTDLFSTPASRAPDLPTGKPIAGFYGSISEWIDIEMLADAARGMPHWNFVLVGPIRSKCQDLMNLPNVHFLGERPHSELPRYLQHWSVSMLPFRDTPQIRACNPLKLREYLAAGTPIATTAFPALESYRNVLSVAERREDFASSIRAAALDRDRNVQRQACMKEETWRRRASEIEAAFEAIRT
jgi:glycosyltransferase involved in cell wall biosynthesis